MMMVPRRKCRIKPLEVRNELHLHPKSTFDKSSCALSKSKLSVHTKLYSFMINVQWVVSRLNEWSYSNVTHADHVFDVLLSAEADRTLIEALGKRC